MILPLYTLQQKHNKEKNTNIKKEILNCYTCPKISGKFRIQPSQNENTFHIILIHPQQSYISSSNITQQAFIQIKFPQEFSFQSINVNFSYYNSQNQLQSHTYTPKQQKNQLKDIIHQIYQQTENKLQPIFQLKKTSVDSKKDLAIKSGKSIQTLEVQDQIVEDSSLLKQNQQNLKIPQKKKLIKHILTKETHNRELTQTKNLNRHFRSKLRQVYKDLMNSQTQSKDSLYIQQVFSPNRVGFEDIRKALKNQWFNKAVKKQMSTGRFLHKILKGMMGVKSKKLMIKYYHVMACAVQCPQSFIKWKYQ